jgi:hypothetical protein
MSTIDTIAYNNLVVKKDDTASLNLAAGTNYTQGMIVVLGNDDKYRHDLVINPEDTPAGTQLPFSEQMCFVLSEDIDLTATSGTSVGYIGEFNRASITFAGGQVESDVAGTLQAKNIRLSDWSVE